MTSYFRPDIKGDAVRKEMVLSQCTVTFFFFEQKVSFQMLTKVRCHLILKGRCPRTSEVPKSCHPIVSQSAPFLQPSQTIPNNHSFLPSSLHLFNSYWAPPNQGNSLLWNQVRHRYFLEKKKKGLKHFSFSIPLRGFPLKFKPIVFVWAGNKMQEGKRPISQMGLDGWLQSFALQSNEKQNWHQVVFQGRRTGERERTMFMS